MNALFSSTTEMETLLFARPLTAGTWLGLALAVIVAGVLFYKREKGLKPIFRGSLITLRILLLVLILCALREPTAVLKETRENKRTLAVVIDASQSMSVRDTRKNAEDVHDAAVALGFVPADADVEEGRPLQLDTRQRNAIATASRLDLARALLTKSGGDVLESLGEDLDIRYYAFGNKVEALGRDDEGAAARITSLNAESEGTALAASIEQIADASRGGSLAGVVLLSDGMDTGARQAETVAHELGMRGIPVYTMPTGVEKPDDISIQNVIVQDVAFVGDTVPVRVQIRSSGYEKRDASLIVRFNEDEVARETVVLEGGLQYVDIDFDARVRAKGAVPLDIEIEAFGDEATADNNQFARSVRVVNEKINVLCIEGSARWEFRYLRAILKRDPRINATFIATRVGNELALHASDYISRFPEDPEEAFKYDLVILGDVDAKFFSAGELSRLEELVRERGGSLLMLAGPAYSPGSYSGSVVERMLPVRFSANEKWQEVDRTIHPVLTSEGRSSLVLTLEKSQARNDRVWTHVSPMDRLPPLLEPRPGATVLATLSDSGARLSTYPLISWQRYGTGKCMLMATDRLWRLRFRTGDKYHWRVWSQCIQFLTLSRLMGEHRQIRMETDRVSYPVGEQVRVYAEVLSDEYEPVMQERYDVFVGAVKEDEESAEDEEVLPGTRVSLRPDSTRPGLYVGYYSPTGTGRYRVEAGEEDHARANTCEFHVADVRPEMANTAVNMERLEEIARLSGGQMIRFADVGKLTDSIDRKREKVVLRKEQALWDNWLFTVLVIGLAGSEWILRRRADLL